MRPKTATLTTGDHQDGTIEIPQKHKPSAFLLARFGEERQVLVPTAMLEKRADGTFFIPAHLDQLEPAQKAKIRIPVVEETARVEKRQTVKGKTRVRKRVTQHKQILDEPLFSEDVEIERVPINQVIDQPVSIRQQGETTIIPIMEEVLVVEKRLVLREEVRITRHKKETHQPQIVTLRREEVEIDHVDMEESPPDKHKPA